MPLATILSPLRRPTPEGPGPERQGPERPGPSARTPIRRRAESFSGSLLLLPFLLAGVVACSDEGVPVGVVPEPPTPASIQVEPTEITFPSVGEGLSLTVTVRDSDGEILPDPEVAFTSTDPTVAVVDAGGLVTAVGIGTASIDLVLGEISAQVSVSVQDDPVGGN
jgi:hypothetical protein